ncbi:MAG: S8 family serine peptidase [Richelia sp. SL_2_1]|nr:S8 family serine peptidase [Richelia sp. SM1_7_0]NJN10769.1 S8 family serine peptidase [Richelia sp. RM1_1_1]NJO26113.1 S8 family serine peptidase [Richelia sp. SL_2_1]
MSRENDFLLTEEELENAGLEIREKWGAKIDDKLDNFLEYQITTSAGDVESEESQRVIVHYKPPKSFEDFREQFAELQETYEKYNEEFEFCEFDELEHLIDESTEFVFQEFRSQGVEIQQHLRLGNGFLTELSPEKIKQIAAREDVEYIEADKPLIAELDQSTEVVGVVSARNQKLAGTGRGIIIAVLDGEVDINHPDLKGRVVHKRNYTDEPWGNPHKHGTHVAGIIAGNGSQYQGIAPGATIWSYKIMPSQSGFKGAEAIEDVIKDMKYGVRIANCSWGVPDKRLDGTSIWAKTADKATKLGLILVKSAGNNGRHGLRSITSPADAKGDLIVVGASSRDGSRVMHFSSRGPTGDNRPKPDILAPGDRIIAAKPNGGYVRSSGTSMAAPHIAGIAALMLERNPRLKPWLVKKILMETAKPLASNSHNYQGKGLVDVVKALQMAEQPLPEDKKITYTSALKQRKLIEQLNIDLQNTSEEIMKGVKVSLVSNIEGIKVTTAEQDYGNLREGEDTTCNFDLEVAPHSNSGLYNLTLNVNYTTSKGEIKTRSHQIQHEIPSFQFQ